MRLTSECAYKNGDMTKPEVSVSQAYLSVLQNATEEHLINVIWNYFTAFFGIVTYSSMALAPAPEIPWLLPDSRVS